MATRIQGIADAVDRFSERHRYPFFGLMAVCLLGGLGGAALAATALLSGPIGVELQEPFLATDISRLIVLQFSAFLSLVFGLGLVALALSWRAAPGWLPALVARPFWQFLGESIARTATPGRVPQRAWLFWACAILAALWANWAILIDIPPIACIEPDSIGYFKASPLRSAGYLLFLKALTALGGGLGWLVPVQLNLMLLSFAALGWSVRATTGSQAAGIVTAVLPMLSSGLLILAPRVMTEALFAALICFHLAAVLGLLRRYTVTLAVVAGLTLGLMIVVRPNGISFLAGLPLILFFVKDHWRSCLISVAAPLAAIVLLQCGFNYQNFGFFNLHRFSGIALAATVAPLIVEDMPGEYPELAAELGPQLRHYARDFPSFEERPWPFEMARVASLTTVGAIYYEILPAIRHRLGLPEPESVAFESDPRLNAIAGSLGRAAILNNPLGFLKIASSNYIANWHITLPIRVPMAIFYPRCLDLARSVIAENVSLASEFIDPGRYDDGDLVRRIDRVGKGGIRLIEGPRMAVGVLQLPLAYLAFAATLAGLILILRCGRSPDGAYRTLALTGLMVQAGYGLISMGNASFARYTVVFDPLMIVMLSAALVLLLRYLFTASAGGDSTSPNRS